MVQFDQEVLSEIFGGLISKYKIRYVFLQNIQFSFIKDLKSKHNLLSN